MHLSILHFITVIVRNGHQKFEIQHLYASLQGKLDIIKTRYH